MSGMWPSFAHAQRRLASALPAGVPSPLSPSITRPGQRESVTAEMAAWMAWSPALWRWVELAALIVASPRRSCCVTTLPAAASRSSDAARQVRYSPTRRWRRMSMSSSSTIEPTTVGSGLRMRKAPDPSCEHDTRRRASRFATVAPWLLASKRSAASFASSHADALQTVSTLRCSERTGVLVLMPAS